MNSVQGFADTGPDYPAEEDSMRVDRRQFMESAAIGLGGMVLASQGEAAHSRQDPMQSEKPNLIYIFADQWRGQACGYTGDSNARTPNLDQLAHESLVFSNCISGCPVCSPYRASLLSGQYWLTHGHFMNDLAFNPELDTFGKVLNREGYETAYIGKWHLDGHGRSAFIPRERRQGFKYWKVLECTHDYNHSFYYADDPEKRLWDGYDALAQSRDAVGYMKNREKGKPFALFLSWGPPHDPYQTAPEQYRKMYEDRDKIVLPPNVPPEKQTEAREMQAGYYAHIAALDACLGEILTAVKVLGLEDNTLLVFTSDHGDLLGSHGQKNKQQPYEESILVPMVLRFPALFGRQKREVKTLINTPDLMPTLLGLCGIASPEGVEGTDFSEDLKSGKDRLIDGALIMCAAPFGQWQRSMGGREYRGIRTERYTYVRDLKGPWLLFDNQADPFQKKNLAGMAEYRSLRDQLEEKLRGLLEQTRDSFEPADQLLARWGYQVDETGTIPYKN